MVINVYRTSYKISDGKLLMLHCKFEALIVRLIKNERTKFENVQCNKSMVELINLSNVANLEKMSVFNNTRIAIFILCINHTPIFRG